MDDCLINRVVTLANLFARLCLHKQKLSSDKSRFGVARVDVLGHLISKDGVRPNDDRIADLSRMPMPSDIKQLRSLLGRLSYDRKFLPDMAHLIRPITALLKKRATFEFTSTTKNTVCVLLAELTILTILVFPDWDEVTRTLAPLASEPPSSRNNALARYAPLPMSRTGLL